MIKERFNSIDIIKGITLIYMVLQHISTYWTIWNPSAPLDVIETIKLIMFFGTTVGPIFLIISGTNLFFSINKKIMKKESKREIFIQISLRALLIFSISTLLQITLGFTLNMEINHIFYWSIFQVIAVSQILYFFIPFLKRVYRMLLYCILSVFMIIAEYIINLINFEPLLFLVRGDWRFFPYTIYLLFGMLIGDLVYTIASDKTFKKLLVGYLILGISFVIILLSFFDFYSNTFLAQFIKSIGFFLILFPIIFYYSDMKETKTSIEKSLIRWGKVSFSLYYIHWGIIASGLFIFPIIFNFWEETRFLVIPLFIAYFITIILLEIFLRIWEKFDYIFGFEWLIKNILPKKRYYEKEIELNSIKE